MGVDGTRGEEGPPASSSLPSPGGHGTAGEKKSGEVPGGHVERPPAVRGQEGGGGRAGGGGEARGETGGGKASPSGVQDQDSALAGSEAAMAVMATSAQTEAERPTVLRHDEVDFWARLGSLVSFGAGGGSAS